MENKDEKLCIDCETVKPLNDFYKSSNGGHQARCKYCYNRYRYQKRGRPTCFQRLPIEKQKQIIECYKEIKSISKLSKIFSEETGIKIHSFYKCKKDGVFN